MTFIQRINESKSGMEGTAVKENSRKSQRPVRNRRYTRTSLVTGQRPQKRLFTPEIKRYLKDWLVRRRENPYPNREEKKHLAHDTGLTYVQICNWFANWRRKLKNTNADRHQQTWGHLIRTYNNRAQGNVEQFSICSDDSIWSEPEGSLNVDQESFDIDMENIQSSPESGNEYHQDSDMSITSKESYDTIHNDTNDTVQNISSPLVLSKWLESAARFQPSENNYSCWADGNRRKFGVKQISIHKVLRHDRDEVEAAFALTTLATGNTHLNIP